MTRPEIAPVVVCAAAPAAMVSATIRASTIRTRMSCPSNAHVPARSGTEPSVTSRSSRGMKGRARPAPIFHRSVWPTMGL